MPQDNALFQMQLLSFHGGQDHKEDGCYFLFFFVNAIEFKEKHKTRKAMQT